MIQTIPNPKFPYTQPKRNAEQPVQLDVAESLTSFLRLSISAAMLSLSFAAWSRPFCSASACASHTGEIVLVFWCHGSDQEPSGQKINEERNWRSTHWVYRSLNILSGY